MKSLLLMTTFIACCNAGIFDFFQNYVQTYLNHAVNPCDDFFGHVCSAAPAEEHWLVKIPQMMSQIGMMYMTDSCKETIKHIEFAEQIKPAIFPDDEAKMLKIREICSADSPRCQKIVEFFSERSAQNMSVDEIIDAVFNMTSYDNRREIDIKLEKDYSEYTRTLCIVDGLFKELLPYIAEADKRTDRLMIKLQEILINKFNNTTWMQRNSSVEKYQKLISEIVRTKFLGYSFEPIAKIASTQANECIKLMFGWHSMEIYSCVSTAHYRASEEIPAGSGFGTYLKSMKLYGKYFRESNTIGVSTMIMLPSVIDSITELGITGFAVAHEMSHAVFNYHSNVTSFPIENIQCLLKHRDQICSQANYKCSKAEKTISEDAADVAAFAAVLDLFQQKKEQLEGVPGLSKEQHLFYTLAALWCTHELDLRGSHSAPKSRINALFMHSEIFQETFSCKKGDGMWREPDQFCHLVGPDATRR